MRAVITDIALVVSGSFAASLIAKATLALGVALVARWLTRRNRAAVRHVVLSAAFVVLLALPVGGLIPSRAIELGPAEPPVTPAAVVLMVPEAPPARAAAPASGSHPSNSRRNIPMETVLAGAWAVGMLALLIPMLAGMWHMRSLRRSASPSPRAGALATRLLEDAGIRRQVDVLQHDAVSGPMTWGVVRPTILLPGDVNAWSDDELWRALVHELEHVQRADWASLCVGRVACAAYWFHPLVWMAWGRLRLDAERACDDAVLQRSEPAAYAHQLVALAERLSTVETRPLLAMAACRDLSTRVRAVLDEAQTRGRAGAVWVATVIVATTVLTAAVAPLRAVRHVQAPSDGAQPPPLAFDVASVKPNKSGAEQRYIRIDPAGGGLTVSNMQLRQLITWAYQIQTFQLEGGPDWIRSDRFDILARPEREVPATGAFFGGQDPIRMMVRTLLADRFQLVMHKETKELPIFELVLAKEDGKLGPQLRPATVDCATLAAARGGTPPPGASGPPGPNPCFLNINPVSVRGGGVTLSALAGLLVAATDRLVIDRTGLTGNWDFDVKYTPDRSQIPPGVEPPVPIDWNGPSLFTAIEEQLGLKLRPARGPVEVLVIDSVQRPTPN